MLIKDLMNMEGRTACITGGGGNIGVIIAETIAELGGDLFLLDRPGTDLTSVSIYLQDKYGIEVENYLIDLESRNERKRFLEKLEEEQRTIDVMVNNAAFVGESNLEGWVTDFEKQDVDTWRRALEVNLTAVFELVQGLVKKFPDGKGVVLNIASIYGILGPDLSLYENTSMGNPAAYAASKGGVIQLTRWLSTVLAPEIRVNCISPGGVFRNQPEIFVEKYVSRTPLNRMATETDFKGAVAYLVSDMSAYVTGQNLAVDGGWSVW